jgi:tetratricopeptide (TPR) repeat protein
MMEHRMYLAMPGVAVLGSFALTSLARANRTAAYAGAVVVMALLATLTYQRNQVWQSALGLWSDAAAKSPGKARVQVNVGVAYHGNGDFEHAIEHYCKALAIDPEIALARDNIEIALEQEGRLDEVIAQLKPKAVQMPDAPAGTVVLEYDVSEVACRPKR